MTPHPMSVRPAPRGAPSSRCRACYSSSKGFTLVELLVALVVGSISLGLAITVLTQYIRTTDRAIWIIQTELDFESVQRFIRKEINEACLVSATVPTTCTPPASATPCTTTSGTTLYLLIPPLNGVGAPRQISYTRNGTELRRTGPPITSTGALGTGADVANVVIMDNLSNSSEGFAPTVSTDCTSATMSLRFSIPNSNDVLNRTFTVSAGSPLMID
jgi:prepilin-type N-terminal cleavage/methylation domain-containing protein